MAKKNEEKAEKAEKVAKEREYKVKSETPGSTNTLAVYLSPNMQECYVPLVRYCNKNEMSFSDAIGLALRAFLKLPTYDVAEGKVAAAANRKAAATKRKADWKDFEEWRTGKVAAQAGKAAK